MRIEYWIYHNRTDKRLMEHFTFVDLDETLLSLANMGYGEIPPGDIKCEAMLHNRQGHIIRVEKVKLAGQKATITFDGKIIE